MLKRTCWILCSDISIFEVVLCHINNFSSLTLINVWWKELDFSSYLFKFLSVRQQYICSTIFFAKFSFLFFSQNFRFIFSQNFLIIFFALFAKQIEVKFREKSENFRIFLERTKCNCEAKWSRKKKFLRFFPFAGNPSFKSIVIHRSARKI